VGTDPAEVSAGSPYVDAGATASDIADGDLSGSIVVTGLPIDTSAEGSHVITYNVSDTSGNPALPVTRTVNVINNTSPGTGVEVTPIDETTGEPAPVDLTFDNVTEAGETTVTSTEAGPPPPSGFKVGNPPIYYDINTTAEFAGSVTVCLTYPEGTFKNESRLKLMHETATGWEDITVSLDTVNNIICGVTDSFSFFTAFELADPVELLDALVAKVEEINLHHGISNALDSKLDAAQEAFTDANFNNDGAAVNSLNAFINHVMAQAGKKITQADADSLIIDAEEIILVINEQNSQ
jgi:hypothetical protein